MVEPLLWRRLGWCRLEVDLAGPAAVEGRGPGAARAAARGAAGRLAARSPRSCSTGSFPTGRASDSPPPRRARWKSPLRYRMLAAGADGDVRRHDERPAAPRHLLGAAREGAELPPGAGPGAAAAAARDRPRRHGGPRRPRDAPRPGCSRRPTACSPSFRCSRARRGAATRPSLRRPWRRGRGRRARPGGPAGLKIRTRRARRRRAARSRPRRRVRAPQG